MGEQLAVANHAYCDLITWFVVFQRAEQLVIVGDGIVLNRDYDVPQTDLPPTVAFGALQPRFGGGGVGFYSQNRHALNPDLLGPVVRGNGDPQNWPNNTAVFDQLGHYFFHRIDRNRKTNACAGAAGAG